MISQALGNIKLELSQMRQSLAVMEDPQLKWDLLGIRKHSHKFFHYLVNEHHEPKKVAVGVFMGILIGTTPLYGAHLFLSLLASLILRLNKFVVYGAANISVPAIAPFLLFFSYQIGHLLFNGQISHLSFEELKISGFDIFLHVFVGSLFLGSFLGLIGGSFTYAMLLKRKKPTDNFELKFNRAYRQLSKLVRKKYKFYGHFLYWKCRLDPAYLQCLEEIEPTASVTDIGGGLGGLCLLHEWLHHGRSPKNVIDWDDRKINCGRAISKKLGYSICFRKQDAYSGEAFPKADAVCLIDVLHYKPIEDQNKLLKSAVEAVNPGGKILIRDMDATSEKTGLTKFSEKLALFFSLTKANNIYPRKAQDVREYLEAAGFEVSILPSTRGQVFANVLIIGKAPIQK